MPEQPKQQLACRTAGLAQENLLPNERLRQVVVFGVDADEFGLRHEVAG
jgi:hypothetical protein